MTDDSDVFALSEVATAQAQLAFATLAAQLFALLPHAEVEHVGATAVPGCVSKGDLDVVVRVARPQFGASVSVLDGVLRRSERNASTDEYMEYDAASEGVVASVQLVVAGSDLDDRFRRVKAILLADRAALADYNALKMRCDGGSMSAYRQAKAELIDAMLAADEAPSDVARCLPLRPGIHE
jgi:GrpB-like predicted nucleotidyltransferase (UPF0157 family)